MPHRRHGLPYLCRQENATRFAGPHPTHSPRIDGVETDVIEYSPPRPCRSETLLLISNNRGIPGTLGCIVRTHAGDQQVFLTNQHVLFGAGTMPNDPVWLIRGRSKARKRTVVGKILKGKIGAVAFRNGTYHVDCAIGSILDETILPPQPSFAGTHSPLAGTGVSKCGSATGTTHGIVVDSNYCERATVGGISYIMENQVIIRSDQRSADAVPFCEKGDSGATIYDASSMIVGLLWGRNAKGEGIASHIDPVLHALDIYLPSSNNIEEKTENRRNES